jgi:hypothetical protein
MRYLLLALVLVSSVSVAAGKVPPGLAISNSADGYKFVFTLPEYQLSEISVDGETYKKLFIEGYGVNAEVGLPQLPQISFNLIIPDFNSIPVITVNKSNGKDVVLSNAIYPVQQPWPKSKPFADRPFSKNKDYYASQGDKKEVVSVSEPFIIAGIPGVTVTIRPFSYNPSLKKLSRFHFRKGLQSQV